ncbi:hypothetical protein G6F42_018277 [Rhizopus arrhizus]|nr:hypothetical protein G6F42_018277 [Rhizopus arrhizus]
MMILFALSTSLPSLKKKRDIPNISIAKYTGVKTTDARLSGKPSSVKSSSAKPAGTEHQDTRPSGKPLATTAHPSGKLSKVPGKYFKGKRDYESETGRYFVFSADASSVTPRGTPSGTLVPSSGFPSA